MEYNIFCGNNKIKYNENYNIIKKNNNVKKIKMNIKQNYLVQYFDELYIITHRKQLKLLSVEILKKDKILINLKTLFDIFNKYDLPIFMYSNEGLIYSRNENKYKIKNIIFFYSNDFLYLFK